MSKEVVKTDKAPGSVGPYSQAIKANGFVFTAGQLGVDPSTGSFAGDDIKSQTRQALENIKTVLKEAGTSLENVVKVTVFLDNIEDFADMNDVYVTFFPENPPARSAFEVARLPLGGKVEIETIALQ